MRWQNNGHESLTILEGDRDETNAGSSSYTKGEGWVTTTPPHPNASNAVYKSIRSFILCAHFIYLFIYIFIYLFS